VLLDQRERIVEVTRLFVEVTRAQAKVDARLLALDVERHRAGEGRSQWLRAAHAAQACREDPAARHVAAEVLAPGLGEGFVRCLARCPGCRCRSTSRQSSGHT
jgi:hypothetical protein